MGLARALGDRQRQHLRRLLDQAVQGRLVGEPLGAAQLPALIVLRPDSRQCHATLPRPSSRAAEPTLDGLGGDPGAPHRGVARYHDRQQQRAAEPPVRQAVGRASTNPAAAKSPSNASASAIRSRRMISKLVAST